jgi:DNA adenine methylase
MNGRIYYEPFLGAASLFINIGPHASRLSDLNPHLIACYKQVRANPKAVATALKRHATRDSKEYYYRVRTVYNQGAKGSKQAARFIYLNRTCFNGIFRVNREGKFNVPYGYKKNPIFPDRGQLVAVAKKLKTARLSVRCFRKSLRTAGKRAFVYLDPPYPPLNGTAYFTHYTPDRFSEADQMALAAAVKRLDTRGALFMMSNADTPLIRRLYKKFDIRKIPVTRFVTCSSHKHKVQELVITNY